MWIFYFYNLILITDELCGNSYNAKKYILVVPPPPPNLKKHNFCLFILFNFKNNHYQRQILWILQKKNHTT